MRWWRRKTRDEDLERELRSHLELEASERQEDGLSADDARYAAQRAFGNTTLVKEETRATWGGAWREGIWQDLRFAARTMVKRPGVSGIAIIVLALGAGANTSIFSVVNAVLLRPLPFQDADRLLTVWSYNRPRGFNTEQVSWPDFTDWRSQNQVFEDMAASTDATYTLTGSGEPTTVIAYQFSANFFQVLGVAPLLGRTFRPGEGEPARSRVALLSHRLWQSRFGADRNLLGKTITLNGAPYSVVGIMPPGIEYPGSTELWTPLTIPPEAENDRAYRFLRILARLKDGATVQQAQTQMNAIARRLSLAYPATNKDDDAANIVSVREMISGDIRPALLVLLGAVGFVLLIACANIANLLLVQAVGRRKEVAIRAALGASRFRLVRQFLTQSIVLGAAGGTLGLVLAFAGTRALVAMFPPTIANLRIQRVEQIPLDGRVLAFALALSLLSALIFGLIPGLHAARTGTSESLKEAERSLAGRSSRRLRHALVAAEVALSVVLLAAAGLAMKSFAHLIGGDLGFNPQNVLTLRLLLSPHRYQTGAQQAALSDQVISRLRSLPGIESVGTVTFLPLSGWWGTRDVAPAQSPPQSHRQHTAVWGSVTPEYFRALRIPLVQGRLFTDRDAGGAPPVAIVSKTLARQLAPHYDLVDKRVDVGGLPSPVTVVGVVGDVHQLGMTSEMTSEVYLPYAQVPVPLMCFAIKAATDPASLVKAVQREIWTVDKDQAVSFTMSMPELVSESVAPQRVVAVLLGLFAGLALLMAVVGIYAVVSFSVAQRTHEIGVRMALGARSGDVLGLVVRQGLAPVAAGLAVGIACSFALLRFLSSVIYGVRPSDPLILAVVSLILTAAAMLASYAPARRASRVDPMVALHYD